MNVSKATHPQATILQKFLKKKKAERAGYSLSVLARRVDLSASFLSQIINGQRPIPLENFEALCSALDLDKESR
ncbi:MAG: XRE family transcriptional regulator, partial [Proteobacteria bacterium]